MFIVSLVKYFHLASSMDNLCFKLETSHLLLVIIHQLDVDHDGNGWIDLPDWQLQFKSADRTNRQGTGKTIIATSLTFKYENLY